MGELIKLTEDWTTITASSVQPLYSALDITQYNTLDFMFMTGVDSSGSFTVAVQLMTGMHCFSNTGWLDVPGATASVNTDRIATFKQIPTITSGLLRYLRWKVTLTGSVATARFHIEGVGRTYR